MHMYIDMSNNITFYSIQWVQTPTDQLLPPAPKRVCLSGPSGLSSATLSSGSEVRSGLRCSKKNTMIIQYIIKCTTDLTQTSNGLFVALAKRMAPEPGCSRQGMDRSHPLRRQGEVGELS